MTALPKATYEKRQYPHSPGMRGKCGELRCEASTFRIDNRDSCAGKPPRNVCGHTFSRRGCFFQGHNCDFAVPIQSEAKMNEKVERKPTSSYKEVRIGNTIYRVTSVFTGEKDLGKTLEQLAIRRAMEELVSATAY
jgi:hypothetical protein